MVNERNITSLLQALSHKLVEVTGMDEKTKADVAR